MAGWHTIKQGECLSSLAALQHLLDWKTIYDHPENTTFRESHPNPNVIAPGARVYLPDPEPAPRSEPTDQKHTFQLKGDKTWLRIVAADEYGKRYQQCDYRLTVGTSIYDGNTGELGLVEQLIDPQAVSAELTMWWPGSPRRHCTWKLKLGWLDPVQCVTGIQARLNNLGHHAGPVDGYCGPITQAAVREFQQKHDLAVDGISGPLTQAKLQEVHGC